MSRDGSRRRDVTVDDVAKVAQVSRSQTARALGNYGAVSDGVRERVLAAAEQLQYRPNEVARSMTTGRSHTLGVVVADIENPHFGLAARGIADTAKKSGYNIILINTDEDTDAEVDAVRVLLDKRVDGFVVAPASSEEIRHLQQVLDARRPLVLLDRFADQMGVPTIAIDMAPVSYECTRYLLEAGHRRVAYISALQTSSPYIAGMKLSSSQVSDRIQGMRQAFADFKCAFPDDLVRFNAGDASSIRDITRQVLMSNNRATALIASDGLIALSMMESIQNLGFSIPTDVSFVMYDDFPWTRLMRPPLTVVAQPAYEMGAAAAAALIRQIAGRPPTEPTPQLTATLIRRESVGPAPHLLNNESFGRRF